MNFHKLSGYHGYWSMLLPSFDERKKVHGIRLNSIFNFQSNAMNKITWELHILLQMNYLNDIHSPWIGNQPTNPIKLRPQIKFIQVTLSVINAIVYI